MKQKKIIQIVGFASSMLLAVPLAAQQSNTSTGQQPYERDREPNRMLQNNQQRNQQDRADKWENKSGDKMHKHADKKGKEHVRASELVGIDVVGINNDKIGEIDEVFVDLESGEVLGAVVSAGGTLGIGDEQYVIHLDDLEYDAEEEHMRISLTSTELRNSPRFREGDDRVFEKLRNSRIRSGETTSAL